MTTGKIDKLVRMANQIGDFYAAMPEKEAAEGAASHLRLYWTPKMIGEIIAASETRATPASIRPRRSGRRVEARRAGLTHGRRRCSAGARPT